MGNTATIMATETAQQQALVMGLGQTGRSVCRYLLARGYRVQAMDSRDHLPPGGEISGEVDITLGDFDASIVAAADLVVLSPGISCREPVLTAMRKDAELVGDVELFAQSCQAPVLAVTGTNGKTTVTTLLGAILADAGLNAEVGGNIGTPVLELLARPVPDYYVLEVSSFQLETTHSLRALGAAVLNLTADHLDRHGDLAHYAAAKARLLKACEHRVLPRADPLLQRYIRVPAWRSFGTDSVAGEQAFGLATVNGNLMLTYGDRVLANCNEFQLSGRHNLLNIQAAMALAACAGVEYSQALGTVRTFAGLPHRTEKIAMRSGVTWINDSKGTNVAATVAALHSLDGPVILLAGGQGKGQDFAPLAAVVTEQVRQVILFGQDREQLATLLQPLVPVNQVENLQQAVASAAASAVAGDSVLLSPACASFDQFDSYQQRGDIFRQLVGALWS